MATYIHILGDSDTRIWQLSGRQRLERSIARLSDVTIRADLDDMAADETVLLLRGDRLYDGRVLASLTDGAEPLALVDSQGSITAVRTTAQRAATLASALTATEGTVPDDLPRYTPAELVGGSRTTLKNLAVPRIEPIVEAERRRLEQHLFRGAYKGVTDLITKWVWPLPAQWATRACIQLGITPNAVTLMSLILAIFTAMALLQGAYITGLAAAWLMTFLDTLDGKLARVSITASRFGDRLDHGVDLIHPPFWYAAWGLGLSGAWELTPGFGAVIALIVATYIGGRLCEGAFQLMAPFSMFVWRPFDSVNRLITARRNPNLLLLTGSLIAGRPDMGLWLVAAWHLISTLILAIRLACAAWYRARGQALSSWLDTVDPATDRDRWVVRLFTQVPPQS